MIPQHSFCFFFIGCLCLLVACKSADTPAPELIQSGIFPDQGIPGNLVYVSGGGFSAQSEVLFNELPGKVLAFADNILMVEVPQGVASGPVMVREGGKTLAGPFPFTTFTPLTTVAGQLTPGYEDGPARTARFNQPYGIAFDASGNLYISDQGNHRIRKMTPTGEVSTLAGGGSLLVPDTLVVDGNAGEARFNSPAGITVDMAGNVLVADFGNNCIRKITSSGMVSTYAGTKQPGIENGLGPVAGFKEPTDLKFDTDLNLYVVDNGNHVIRKIAPHGLVSNYAGNFSNPSYIFGTAFGSIDGPNLESAFFRPRGIAVIGTDLYVADSRPGLIRRVTPLEVRTLSPYLPSPQGGGQVSSTPGFKDGEVTQALYRNPTGIAADGKGDLYIADRLNNRIRKISGGQVTTVAGGDRSGGINPETAGGFLLNAPAYIAIHPTTGEIYVADQGNNRIVKFKAK
jgi:DNA-binding beta-propeller fold protein YncE